MPSAVRLTGGLAMAMVAVCSACSSTPPQTSAAPALVPGVEARILPMFQGLIVFDINQPTYVAVFDVRPYVGIEMIYPGPNEDGRAIGGVQAVPVFHLVQATEERQVLATPPVGTTEEYLYLVASRTPLDLGEFADHPIALTEAANVNLKGLGPYEQIDSLMRNVVKPQYDRDWDADVLIITPRGTDPSISGVVTGPTCDIDAKMCPHSDHVVRTVATSTGTDPLSRNLAQHYAINGATRGTPAGATTAAADRPTPMSTVRTYGRGVGESGGVANGSAIRTTATSDSKTGASAGSTATGSGAASIVASGPGLSGATGGGMAAGGGMSHAAGKP